MLRILKYAAIASAVVLSLAAGGLFAAGKVIDSKSDALLSRVQSKLPGLQLKNRFNSSGSLLSRSGRLFFNYEKKDAKILGQPYLRGAVDYKVQLSLEGVQGTFSRALDYGNLDDITKPLGISPVNFSGDFKLNPYVLSLGASIHVDPLSMPVPDGTCTLTPVLVEVSTGPSAVLHSTLSTEALSCTSPLNYNDQPAYTAVLKGLRLRAAPNLKKLSEFSEVRVAFESLRLEGSTLYLIGFEPDQRVKDPSLREEFSLTQADYVLSFKDRDREGFGVLGVSGSGSYSMGNSVRENTRQKMFDLSNTDIDLSGGKINPKKLKSVLSESGSSPSFESLLGLLSKNVVFDVKKLHLEHESGKFDMDGSARGTLGKKGPEKIEAGFNLTADQTLIQTILEAQYQHLLEEALKTGAVTFSGDTYKTKLQVKDGSLTFNGIKLQESSTDTELEEAELEDAELKEAE